MTRRCFVGFSSTDKYYYDLMTAWKTNENIDFDFIDCQLHQAIDSENEEYIKRRCRERIEMSSRYILLIGQDTKYKYKYVRWEAEVALEKGCTIIGVNLNKKRNLDEDLCPTIIRNVGAIFVPFSSKIIQYALEHYIKKDSGNWYYKDEIYKRLGY